MASEMRTQLEELVQISGVSEEEQDVAKRIQEMLLMISPAFQVEIDDQNNVIVRFQHDKKGGAHILFDAHIDQVVKRGIAPKCDPRQYMHATALDNRAGVCVLLELCRMMVVEATSGIAATRRWPHTRFTLVFAAAEELGYHGAQYYAAKLSAGNDFPTHTINIDTTFGRLVYDEVAPISRIGKTPPPITPPPAAALADGTYSSSAQAAAQAAAQEALTCIVPESLVMPALRLANGQIITLRGDLHIDDDNKVPAIGAGACCSWLAKSPQHAKSAVHYEDEVKLCDACAYQKAAGDRLCCIELASIPCHDLHGLHSIVHMGDMRDCVNQIAAYLDALAHHPEPLPRDEFNALVVPAPPVTPAQPLEHHPQRF